MKEPSFLYPIKRAYSSIVPSSNLRVKCVNDDAYVCTYEDVKPFK